MPARYNRRLNYSARAKSSYVNDLKLVRNDIAIIKVPVGNYICTIAFNGVIRKLIDIVKSQPNGNVTLQSVIKAVARAVDNTDVLVDCTCDDWKYRFSYYASKYHYKYGKPETRPPKKTNPNDKLGSMCKHLTSILANKTWMIKLSSIINDMIKSNYDEIIRVYRLDPNEFFINKSGHHSPKNVSKLKEPDPYSTTDISTQVFDDDDDENDEELELNINGAKEVDDGSTN